MIFADLLSYVTLDSFLHWEARGFGDRAGEVESNKSNALKKLDSTFRHFIRFTWDQMH